MIYQSATRKQSIFNNRKFRYKLKRKKGANLITLFRDDFEPKFLTSTMKEIISGTKIDEILDKLKRKKGGVHLPFFISIFTGSSNIRHETKIPSRYELRNGT